MGVPASSRIQASAAARVVKINLSRSDLPRLNCKNQPVSAGTRRAMSVRSRKTRRASSAPSRVATGSGARTRGRQGQRRDRQRQQGGGADAYPERGPDAALMLLATAGLGQAYAGRGW